MAFADGNLVDGNLPQVFELRPRESLLQVVFDDFLDDIPTDAQMQGDIPNGHHPRQFQNILGETPNIRASGIGKPNGGLTNGIAVAALDAGNAKHDRDLPTADRQSPKPSHYPAFEDGVLAATRRATMLLSALSDGERYAALGVFRVNIPVATDTESVVQQTGDMLILSVLRVVSTTPYEISMSAFFQPLGTLPPDEPHF